MQGSAGSGIGKATAGLFAKEGAKVVVSDINEANGISTVDDIIKNGGEAFFIKADTSQPKDNEAMVKHTIQKYGGPVDGWQKVIDINLSGVFYGLRYQIPAMLKKRRDDCQYRFHTWERGHQVVSRICGIQTWCCRTHESSRAGVC